METQGDTLGRYGAVAFDARLRELMPKATESGDWQARTRLVMVRDGLASAIAVVPANQKTLLAYLQQAWLACGRELDRMGQEAPVPSPSLF